LLRADYGEMEHTPHFVARDGRRQDGFDPASRPAGTQTAKCRKIDAVLRAAYKKFGRGKFTRQALALGLRKQRSAVK
jgi:hypothetical protein